MIEPWLERSDNLVIQRKNMMKYTLHAVGDGMIETLTKKTG